MESLGLGLVRSRTERDRLYASLQTTLILFSRLVSIRYFRISIISFSYKANLNSRKCLCNFTAAGSKSRPENPQKLIQLSPRCHPRHLVGKRTAEKDVIKDSTSDSQVNSHFPYRWSPASLTLNIYFYLFSIFISNENTKHTHTFSHTGGHRLV